MGRVFGFFLKRNLVSIPFLNAGGDADKKTGCEKRGK